MHYFDYYKNLLSESDFSKLEKSLEKPFRKSIRVNTLKISIADFKKIAKEKKWVLTETPWCKEGFFVDRVDTSIPLGKDLLHLYGYFYIQEASSMIPPEIFEKISKDDLILDLAAAPGSKFTQLCAKGKEMAFLVANEPSGARISGLVSNIKRLGIKNSVVVKHDPSFLARELPNTFTKISLDAPCSGDGMIRRESEIMKKWTMSKIKFQSGIQKRLITEAFKLLKPGGELVYSTCTLSKEEDEEVLEHLLRSFPGNAEMKSFTFVNRKVVNGALRIWPFDFDTEGFFVSKITKKKETEENKVHRFLEKEKKSVIDFLPRKKAELLEKYLEKQFAFEFNISEDETLIEKEGEVFIWPKNILKIYKKLKPVHTGLFIGKFFHDDFVLSHDFASIYGKEFTKNIVEIEDNESIEYLKGKDLHLKTENSGITVIKNKAIILGLAKSDQTILKNVLPRNLVIS